MRYRQRQTVGPCAGQRQREPVGPAADACELYVCVAIRPPESTRTDTLTSMQAIEQHACRAQVIARHSLIGSAQSYKTEYSQRDGLPNHERVAVWKVISRWRLYSMSGRLILVLARGQ